MINMKSISSVFPGYPDRLVLKEIKRFITPGHRAIKTRSSHHRDRCVRPHAVKSQGAEESSRCRTNVTYS